MFFNNVKHPLFSSVEIQFAHFHLTYERCVDEHRGDIPLLFPSCRGEMLPSCIAVVTLSVGLP